ncbi:hypothetical protein RSSM_01024 [Rhodopirellula sallentina SM41]|uniref:Uncharacterized protein n=1 Tax=Rhodopirellula sallentina SM41 TaxID=1263870 RepID=M5U8B9_9BACT|nr:hypothetical protein RSSM_01024 [Rhodopirellula sallentina SM41]
MLSNFGVMMRSVAPCAYYEQNRISFLVAKLLEKNDAGKHK